MAPLVPEILSNEFSFVIAFLVGIGFGFALEQAGFSSSRKLVGLFYGYDFTVLKVFFTAGVTALVGVILLSHMGLLDLGRVYVNPMFLHSALIGGAIMGVGFILGGFCPGTSICSAAVGRLDAMTFIIGGAIGIFIFMEGYPLFDGIYRAGAMGVLRVDQALGLSPEVFAILLAAVAITAFFFTSKLEDKISGREVILTDETKKKYRMLAITPLALLLLITFTPDADERLQNRVEARMSNADYVSIESMQVDELTFELVNHAQKYHIIDVRDTARYGKNSIPTAINIPLEELSDRAWKQLFTQPYKRLVFIGDQPDEVRRAAILAQELGDEDPIVFEPAVARFQQVVFEASLPEKPDKIQRDRYDFYIRAAKQLRKLEERLKRMQAPVQKQEVVVKGGCA